MRREGGSGKGSGRCLETCVSHILLAVCLSSSCLSALHLTFSAINLDSCSRLRRRESISILTSSAYGPLMMQDKDRVCNQIKSQVLSHLQSFNTTFKAIANFPLHSKGHAKIHHFYNRTQPPDVTYAAKPRPVAIREGVKLKLKSYFLTHSDSG